MQQGVWGEIIWVDNRTYLMSRNQASVFLLWMRNIEDFDLIVPERLLYHQSIIVYIPDRKNGKSKM